MPLRPAALCAAALIVSATAATADDCAAPVAAMRLTPTKSYTSTMVFTRAGKPRTDHAVLAGGYLYIQVDGAWKKSVSAKDMLDDVNDKLKTAKMTCKRGGSEIVDGQLTTIYTVRNVTEDVASDSRLWISAAGLPLKTEIDLGSGELIVSTLDYSHAQVPPGVK